MNHTDQKLRALFAAGPVTGHEIAYALTLKGYSQTRVAELCGVTRGMVYQVLFRDERSHNVASKIAEILGQPLNRLWADGRYDRPPRAEPAERPRRTAAA